MVSAFPQVWLTFSTPTNCEVPGEPGSGARSHACAHALALAGGEVRPPPGPQRAAPSTSSAGAREARAGAAWIVGRRPSGRHVSPGSGGAAVVAELLRLRRVEVEGRQRLPGAPGGGRPWGRAPAPPCPDPPAPADHRLEPRLPAPTPGASPPPS